MKVFLEDGNADYYRLRVVKYSANLSKNKLKLKALKEKYEDKDNKRVLKKINKLELACTEADKKLKELLKIVNKDRMTVADIEKCDDLLKEFDRKEALKDVVRANIVPVVLATGYVGKHIYDRYQQTKDLDL